MPDNKPQPLTVSPWWSRLGVRMGLFLPQFLRRRLGLYRWAEVLSASPANLIDASAYEAGNGIPPVRPNIHKAVQRLVSAGIEFPSSRAPWPHALEHGACSWNRDVVWAYSDKELDAWLQVWNKQPHKKKYVDQALAVACANANPYAVSVLLDAGGDPTVDSGRAGKALDRLFSSSRIEHVIECLKHLSSTQSKWIWPKPDFYPQIWSVAQLNKMEAQGIKMPVAWQLSWADAAFRDAPFSGYDALEVRNAAQVMLWWWSDDRLGAVEGARSQLLATWLSSIRPGVEENYQQDVMHYWDALFPSPKDPIPAEPADGSGKSWMHRWASSIFPAAIPLPIVEAFMALPSFVPGSKDSSGMTVEELFEDRVQSQRSLQDDPEDILAYQRATALLQASQLSQTTSLPETAISPDKAIVRRPSRRL
jgi:hypothetical protein